MTFRQRLALLIAGGPKVLRQARREQLTPWQLLSFFRAGEPVWTELTVQKATREGYRLSVHVYRAVRTIVQAASAVPWVVMRRRGDRWEPDPEHPLQLLLERPNPWQSGQDLMEMTIAHLQLVGNALWQPVIVNGRVREIWPVMPDKVQPIPANRPGEWLQAWRVDIGDGRIVYVEPDAFIHMMLMDPGNPYWGTSPLMAAARTVDTDNEMQAWQKATMQQRGIPDGVITHEAIMTREQFEEAVRQVQEQYEGRRNSRRPWVLGAGAKWQPMAMTPVEMDWIASRLQNKRDIAEAFGISPIFLGDLEQSSYNNMQEARKSLYEDVVLPLLADIRSTLNLRLVPLFGEDIWMTFDASEIPALREDYGKKVDQADKLWRMGVPFNRIDEQLELGFGPIPGGDVGYIPFSVVPIAQATASSEGTSGEIRAVHLETEEQRAAYWRAIDRRREGWVGAATRRVRQLFDEEAEAVARAVEARAPGEAEVAALQAVDEHRAAWEREIAAILLGVIDDMGEATAQTLTGEAASAHGPAERRATWDPFTDAVLSWVARYAAQHVTQIAETTRQAIRQAIAEAWRNNEGSPQIARRIRALYQDMTTRRAYTIARTEVAAAAGFGQREAARQSGVVKTHTWISSRDDRVRDSHAAIDGETRPFDEPYSNGLMYPGDPNGPPSEVIQCRCVEAFGVG